MLSLTKDEGAFWQAIVGDEKVISYDLYAVNASMPYSFGLNNEFFASPRIDNLTSVFASLEALISHADSNGVCMSAFFNNEEIGSTTTSGAGGDFLERTLRKIAFALRFDDNEFEKALASSFLLSVDNAHAVHPAHPEKSDPTNKVMLGGGIVIKSHANGAYITDALSSAVVKTVFEKAGVAYQTFFNRSDMRSGGTLGTYVLRQLGMHGVDIGLAQHGMHSACETFCAQDLAELVNGLTAMFSTNLLYEGDGFLID
jgi:aspartyl aminopeptidase